MNVKADVKKLLISNDDPNNLPLTRQSAWSWTLQYFQILLTPRMFPIWNFVPTN